MIHRMFSVYDVKAELYMLPFYCKTMALALRMFTDSVNEQGHQFNSHPEDYTLFELALFDDNSASFEVHAAPLPMATAIEIIKSTEG